MTESQKFHSATKPVTIRVRPVGQYFGCIGYLMRGAAIVDRTDVAPYGMESVAYARAEALAQRRGLTVSASNVR